jgi:hypothetical protein
MKQIGLMAWVLVLEALVWLVIWRNIPFLNLHDRITGGPGPAWYFTAAAAAFALCVRSDTRKPAILLAVLSSALAANIVNISYDVLRYHATLGFDQDHSFLIELPVTAKFAVVGAAIGLVIASVVRRGAAAR